MFKLIFGLMLFGLIVYVIYQVRNETVKYKNMQGALENLHEINNKLDTIAVENDVQDAKEKLYKRSTKLDNRVTKLSNKQESNKED